MAKFKIQIDPDGTQGADWLYVIVKANTGVIYECQCAGQATESRAAEGFLVPIWGVQINADNACVAPSDLRAIFHKGSICLGYSSVGPLEPSRLLELKRLISTIPYWKILPEPNSTDRHPLELDQGRISELAEAWVPVRTPDGAGILVWKNCD